MTQISHFNRFAHDMDTGNLSDNDYGRILDRADQEVKMITESLEVVTKTGTVSRAMISPVAGFLPGVNLNTFTGIPTATNHGFAMEALSKGVKIALAVGAAAVLGTVIFYALRAKGRAVAAPNAVRAKAADDAAAALDKAAPIAQQAAAEIGQVVESARAEAGKSSGDNLTSGDAVVEAVKDIEQLEQFMKKLTVNQILDGTNANALTAHFLIGDYDPLINNGAAELADMIALVCGIALQHLVAPLLKFDGSTTAAEMHEKHVMSFHKAIEASGGDSMGALKPWLVKQGLKLPDLDKDGSASVYVEWSAKFLSEHKADASGDHSPASLSKESLNADVSKKIVKCQEAITELAGEMEKVKGHLEKFDVPREVSKRIRDEFEELKFTLAMADQFIHICAHEVVAYNLAANLKGKKTAESFKKATEAFSKLKIAASRSLYTIAGIENVVDKYEKALFSDYQEVIRKAKSGS